MKNPAGIGIVIGYRRGSNEQYIKQVLIKVISASAKKVDDLISAKLLVKDIHGNEYHGKIVRVHARGRNNVVIGVFNRNLPGQTIGAEVLIYK